MSVTKGSGTSVIASTTTTTTSSPISAAGDYATDIYIIYSQNSTVATVGGQVQVLVSPDGGTSWYAPLALLVVAPLTASTITSWVISLPPSTTSYKCTYTVPTGGTGTCEVQSNDVTGV